MKAYQLLLSSSFVFPCQYTILYINFAFFSLKFSLSLGNLLLPSQRKFKDHESSAFAPWFSFYSLVFPFTAFKAVLKLVIVSLVSFHFSLSHSAPSALLSGSCLVPLYISVSCLILSSFISCFVVFISIAFYCKTKQTLSRVFLFIL